MSTVAEEIDPLKIYTETFRNVSAEVHIWKLIRDENEQIQSWSLYDANPAALKAWGKKLEDIQGKRTEEIFPEADPLSNFMPIVQKIFSENSPYSWRSFFAGTNQVLEMTSIPMGEYFISTGLDATGKIETENFLNQAHRLDSLGAIAGGVIHDINNLLGIIAGNARILKKSVGEQEKNRVNRILDACKKSSELTKRILLYSRGDKVKAESINLKQEISAIIQLLETTLPKNIQINFAGKDINGDFLGNKIQMAQIFFNLFSNAINAMNEDGGELKIVIDEIQMKKKDIPPEFENIGDGNYVRIKVEDTGPGIPSECLNKIFKPFYSQNSTKKSTGLGLSIVKSLVQNNKGFITVETELGKGTCFSVFFLIS